VKPIGLTGQKYY